MIQFYERKNKYVVKHMIFGTPCTIQEFIKYNNNIYPFPAVLICYKFLQRKKNIYCTEQEKNTIQYKTDFKTFFKYNTSKKI